MDEGYETLDNGSSEDSSDGNIEPRTFADVEPEIPSYQGHDLIWDHAFLSSNQLDHMISKNDFTQYYHSTQEWDAMNVSMVHYST